jgi:hypothetical protein
VRVEASERVQYNTFVSVQLRNYLQSHGSPHLPRGRMQLLNPQDAEHMKPMHVNHERVLRGRPPYLRQAYSERTATAVANFAKRMQRPFQAGDDMCADEQLVPLLFERAIFRCSCCPEEYPLPVLLPCRHVVCVQCCMELCKRGMSLFPPVPDEDARTTAAFDAWLDRTEVCCPLARCQHRVTLLQVHEINLAWELFDAHPPPAKGRHSARLPAEPDDAWGSGATERPSRRACLVARLARRTLHSDPKSNLMIVSVSRHTNTVGPALENEEIEFAAYANQPTLTVASTRLANAEFAPSYIREQELTRFRLAGDLINKRSADAARLSSLPYNHPDRSRARTHAHVSLSSEQRAMLQLVKQLMGAGVSKGIFNQPVNFDNPAQNYFAPDYLRRIAPNAPMDFGRIHAKLLAQHCAYHTCEEVQRDVELVFENALCYNSSSSWIHRAASESLLLARKNFKRIIRQRAMEADIDNMPGTPSTVAAAAAAASSGGLGQIVRGRGRYRLACRASDTAPPARRCAWHPGVWMVPSRPPSTPVGR